MNPEAPDQDGLERVSLDFRCCTAGVQVLQVLNSYQTIPNKKGGT